MLLLQSPSRSYGRLKGHGSKLQTILLRALWVMYFDFDWKDAPLSSRTVPVITGERCVPIRVLSEGFDLLNS